MRRGTRCKIWCRNTVQMYVHYHTTLRCVTYHLNIWFEDSVLTSPARWVFPWTGDDEAGYWRA